MIPPIHTLQTAMVVLLIFGCIEIFCHTLPQRSAYSKRLVLISVIIISALCLYSLAQVGPMGASVPIEQHVLQALIFCGTFIACGFCSWFLHDAPIWTIMFYASIGYTVQNLASGILGVLSMTVPEFIRTPITYQDFLRSSSLFIIVCLCLATLTYRLFKPFIEKTIPQLVGNQQRWRISLIVVPVIVFEIIFSQLIQGSSLQMGSLDGQPVILSLIQISTAVATLFIQMQVLRNINAQTEAKATSALLAEQGRQQQLLSETLQEINARCHDIQHQITAIKQTQSDTTPELNNLSNTIKAFSSYVNTGNDTLDVILTEKSILCQQQNIALSVSVDGRLLSFLTPDELTSLFGNAFDNAITACQELPTAERSIILDVKRVGDMMSIHMENPFAGNLNFIDGLPQSRQVGGLHGYGTRSIRLSAEHHDGFVHFTSKDSIFHLNILIPLPE